MASVYDISFPNVALNADNESVFAPIDRAQERQAKQNALAAAQQQQFDQRAVRNLLASSIDPATGMTNFQQAFMQAPTRFRPDLQAAQQAEEMRQVELGGKKATAAKAMSEADKQFMELTYGQLAPLVGRPDNEAAPAYAAIRQDVASSRPYLARFMPETYSQGGLKQSLKTAEMVYPKLEFQNAGDRIIALDPYTNTQVGPAYRVGKSPNTQTTNINLPALENAEQKGQGELNVKTYEGLQNKANLARKTAPAIDTALAVLDKGFGTGTGTATTAKIAGVLSALGVPEATAYASDAAVFQSTVQQTVLDRQFEQKGPQTEADAARITQTAANLGNPTDANRFLLNIAKAQAKRDIAHQRFFAKWFSTNNTYRGAEEAWLDGEGGKSLFADPTLSKYAPKEERPAAAPATTTAAAPPNAAAIQHLRSNPSLAAAFDEFYGAGASAKYLPKGK
jgi:hypothetical protein